jgi:hypothetical protein
LRSSLELRIGSGYGFHGGSTVLDLSIHGVNRR